MISSSALLAEDAEDAEFTLLVPEETRPLPIAQVRGFVAVEGGGMAEETVGSVTFDPEPSK